ncbi:MAG: hypothetical protein K6G11_10475, partial [Lachnospiraceae bacterium]|nr:hypothetical protein [Lachnospiraceae bacterium]
MKKALIRAIIKRFGKLFIAMMIVSSLGFGLMLGMGNGFLSLKNSLNDYLEEMNYPDAVIMTDITTREDIDRISKVSGVEKVDARLNGNLVVQSKEGRCLSVQAMTYEPDEFQKFYYWEKTDTKDEDAILLEEDFAKNNNFHTGDKITVRMDDKSKECTVGGLVSRPEMFAYRKIYGVEVISSEVGFIYIPGELLKKIDNREYDD